MVFTHQENIKMPSQNAAKQPVKMSICPSLANTVSIGTHVQLATSDLARNGTVFTRFGDLKLRNARHKNDPQPLDTSCTCHACAGTSGVSWDNGGRDGFSRAYMHHLDRCGEIPEPDARSARVTRRGPVLAVPGEVQERQRAGSLKYLSLQIWSFTQ
jgi:hypothetical protein